MKRMMLFLSLTAVLLMTAAMNRPLQDDEKLQPSEARREFNKQAFRIGNKVSPAELAGRFLARCDTSGDLEPAEWNSYAYLLHFAKRDDEARSIYQRFAQGNDDAGRAASEGLITIERDSQNWEALAAGVKAHRARFKPTSQHATDLYNSIYMLVSHYKSEGEHAKAARLMLDEMEVLSFDYPYMAFGLIPQHYDAFVDAGMKEECLAEIARLVSELEQGAGKLKADIAEDDEQGRKNLDGLGFYKTVLEKTAMILNLHGAPAPDLAFNNQMNTSITSLADLRGKVVMIDFWTNWCGPCKASFPELKEFYAKYKNQGFEIVGVTYLQGVFTDGDIQESGLDQAKEVSLTADFVKRYKMDWPVTFIGRTDFDKFGITSIPTIAIIDKKGIIRSIRSGTGPGNRIFLNKVIPELLAEA